MRISKFAWLVAVIVAGIPAGCANNTNPGTRQSADQSQTQESKTKQESAAMGATVYFQPVVYVGNAPGRSGAAVPTSQPAMSLKNFTDGGGPGFSDLTGASYAMSGTHITFGDFSVGSTTPTLTGTATGSGSATSYPNATASGQADQTVKPGVAASLGVAMPGGNVSQSPTATTEGSTSNPQHTPSQTASNTETNTRTTSQPVTVTVPQIPMPLIPPASNSDGN